jgi:HK97 family phage major capsid protein
MRRRVMAEACLRESTPRAAERLASLHKSKRRRKNMSLSVIRQKREERAKAVADAQVFIPKAGEKWTPEARQKFDGFMAEADRLKEEIADLERQARAGEHDAELRQTTRPPQEQVEANAVEARVAAIGEYRNVLRRHGLKGLEKMKPESRAVVERMREQWSEALRDYLLRGEGKMSEANRNLLAGANAEFRQMGIASGAIGGYLVPQGYVYEIEEAMKWYGDMLKVCSFLDTATGNPMPHPTDNDTTITGELVAENTQVSEQEITIGSITFNAWKFSTKLVKVSIELLQDSAFDIDSYIRDKFAIRLGRILNTKFTLGAGSGSVEPNGIITAATAGPTAIGSATNTGGTENGTNTVGSTDLVELEHSVDRAYRRGAAFMMHDLTEKYLKELLDKYGRPLWRPGVSSGEPDTINGYPYFINNDLATLATGHKTVLFGQLNKYVVRRVKELAIMRLVERGADYGQVWFIGFARYDGNLLDAGTHPVKYLLQA